MKKNLYQALLFMLLGSFTLNAQTASTTSSVKSPFQPGWYVGANGGWNLYLAEGNNFFDKNKPSYVSLKDNSGFLGRLALGYNFTPTIGLRGMMGYSYHYWPDTRFKNPDGSYVVDSWGAENLTADLMVNLSNWWGGYNPKRLLDISLYAGPGFAHRDKANFPSDFYTLIGRGGVEGDFRLTSRLDLNLMAELNAVGDNYNNYVVTFPLDVYGAITVGLTYTLGKDLGKALAENTAPVLAPKPTPDTTAVKPANTQPAAHPEASVQQQPAPEPATAPVAANQSPAIPTPPSVSTPVPSPAVTPAEATASLEQLWVNVFYPIGKTNVVTARQKEAVNRIVSFLQQHPEAKIVVTGYADRGTGTAAVNNRISRLRAEKMTKLLTSVYMIPADRITTNWKGDRVQLFKQDNMNRLTTLHTPEAQPFGKMKKLQTSSQGTTSAATSEKSSGLNLLVPFTSGSTDASKADSKGLVMKMALYLRQHPNAKVTVCGYADKTEADANTLSQKRAVDTGNLLILRYSIDKKRVAVKWFGSGVQRQPKGQNSYVDLMAN